MKRIIFTLVLILFIVGCKSNNITGGAIADIETDIIAENSCKDTDGGVDKENRGTVSGFEEGEEYEIQDKCISGLLIEFLFPPVYSD